MTSCEANDKLEILFCPLHATSLSKMVYIANGLVSNQIRVVFLLSKPEMFYQRSMIREQGFEVICIGRHAEAKRFVKNKLEDKAKEIKRPVSILRRIYEWMYPALLNTPLLSKIFQIKEERYRKQLQILLKVEYSQKQIEVVQLFNNNSFDRIVVAGDRNLQYEVVLLAEANKRNIPVFIPPIAMSGMPEDEARMRLDKSKEFDVTKQQLIQARWPMQCQGDGYGNKVSFYPYWFIEPLDELNLLPSAPWVLGRSFSGIVMVSGLHQDTQLRECGMPAQRVVITGDPEFDCLYKSLQDKPAIWQQLLQKYQLDENKKTIVVSLPQLYEHKLLPYDQHWEVVNHICDCLQALEVNVLVSLHPKMKLDNYQHLEKEYLLVIVEEPLREILVVADVFVASQGSSTWLWAVLCGIPCLLCDWYGLDYEDFIDGDCGVQIIKQKEQLQVQLNRLFEDEVFYKSQREKQLAKQHELALFDGRAMERISTLLKS